MATGGGLFVDYKRGEEKELKNALRTLSMEREQEKRRDVIKKVIAYMTLGIDMSRLFSEMIMAASTKDLVQKKMVYLYICNYAKSNADLSLLTLNTLIKDCRDEDPMVRGLALRALCSFRVKNIVEYLVEPLKRGLMDASPYVRKTAVLGVLKLFYLCPEALDENDLTSKLMSMLTDKDPQVVINCIVALNEVLSNGSCSSTDGFPPNRQLVLSLLNRIREFTEWGQCVVLELVSRYQPEDESENWDIMNVLEPLLRHNNAALVLGVTKVFLRFTQNFPDVYRQVHERLKTPLLTLMSGASVEQLYPTLCHIITLVERCPEAYQSEFKCFFLRFNDPSYIKLLKLQVLTEVSCDNNCAEIVDELSEYVRDVDPHIAREAIRAIGAIAIRVPACSQATIQSLVALVDLSMDHVNAGVAIEMKDILRKYPGMISALVPVLKASVQDVDDPEAIASLVWVLGEFADRIDDAPYLLEPMLDNFADMTSEVVKLELLTAAMKMFFKRPPETQKMLGRLFVAGAEDVSHVDVHDRALFYYRLLRTNPTAAEQILQTIRNDTDFRNEDMGELKDRIFEEFNSFSVIYGKPEDMFVVARERGTGFLAQDDESASSSSDGDDDDDDDDGHDHGSERGPSGRAVSPPPPQAAPAAGSLAHDVGSLLDIEGVSLQSPPPSSSLNLVPDFKLDPKVFQSKWQRLGCSGQLDITLPTAPSAQDVEMTLKRHNVMCMASGAVGYSMKFFFYAQDAQVNQEDGSELHYLCEVVVTNSTKTLTVKFKSDDIERTPLFVQHFRQALGL
eukprot:Rmarinus@m.11305